ncbi:MAG TPA: hypothetical protein VM324_17075 [Egibacteraceae bacterium]|nr:hypothetical protein [Egibacteraceae bacterium]
MVIADCEAGIGTLTRLAENAVDVVVIVVEAMSKSLEVGARAAELAGERAAMRTVVLANRIRGEDDLERIRAAFPPGVEVVGVPDDPVIVEADRKGIAPLDLDPDAPAVAALAALAEDLLPAS